MKEKTVFVKHVLDLMMPAGRGGLPFGLGTGRREKARNNREESLCQAGRKQGLEQH